MMQTNLPPWEHLRSTSGVGASAAHAIGKCWTPGRPLTSGGCSLWSATCNQDETPGAPTFHLMSINGETKHIRLLQKTIKKKIPKQVKHVIKKNILNNSNQVTSNNICKCQLYVDKILFLRKLFLFLKLLQFHQLKNKIYRIVFL